MMGKIKLIMLASTVVILFIVVTFSLMLKHKVKFQEAEEMLIVSTPLYEVGFHSLNGGIAYMQDKSSGYLLSSGNREQQLWWAFTSDKESFKADDPFASKQMDYVWSRSKQTLEFRYWGPMPVVVTIDFSREDRFTMQAEVDNRTERVIESFRFPYELRLASSEIKDALLPMLPGVKLKPTFFTENNSFEGQYPGVMFASFSALRLAGSHIALYDVFAQGDAITSVDIGYKSQVDEANRTALVHQYKTWIEPAEAWLSPLVVIKIGGDYQDAINAYGADNGIDAYRGLSDKLGKEEERYYQSPLYKLDIAAIGRETWSTLSNHYVDKMDHQGILHLVGFQEGGHDENYPDFIPPASKWGSMDDFKAFITAAKHKGNLVVPYTNFSWWGVHSPTLANLPSELKLEDIVVSKHNGMLMKEDYGPHSGYVMNPSHPYVRTRIAAEHEKLIKEAGFDGIFEDQWGARNAPYVFHPTKPAGTNPSNAYFEGVREYLESVEHQAFQEVGIDVLAKNSTGFLGSNYLWDLLGYRTKSAPYTDYYPMAGMLLRDKVLMYQHNLAAETMTSSKAMLRWNMAMGFQLSGDLLSGTDNPWLDVAGVYQQELLWRYADLLVKSYEQLSESATLTRIGEYEITANWDDQEELGLAGGEFTLAPGGVEAIHKDETVRGGIYLRYNGADLDPGDHYLVEVREEDQIKIYQPMGSDTTIRIRMGKKWPHAAASAYRYDGTWIADLPVVEEGDYIRLDYIGLIHEQEVGYVGVTRSNEQSAVKDVSFKKREPKINLALGRSIVSSTNTAEAFPAANANDGDAYTYWESMPNRFPQSLTIDLGEIRQVRSISLKLPPLDAWETREQEIEVWISEDGKAYTQLLAAQPYTFDPTSGNELAIPLTSSGAAARFIRLTWLGNTAWPAAQVSEFEVY
jgi:hypothetical protein